MKAIKKISIKNVVGGKADIVSLSEAGNGAAVPLMRVGGFATAYDTGSSNFGDWTSLKGDFQAVNISTGEVFRAPAVFLPEAYTNAVVTRLSEEGVTSIEVGVDVNAHWDESSTTGYTYTTTLLMPSQSDPVSKLLDTLPPVEKVIPRLTDESGGEGEEKPVTKKKAKK